MKVAATTSCDVALPNQAPAITTTCICTVESEMDV